MIIISSRQKMCRRRLTHSFHQIQGSNLSDNDVVELKRTDNSSFPHIFLRWYRVRSRNLDAGIDSKLLRDGP